MGNLTAKINVIQLRPPGYKQHKHLWCKQDSRVFLGNLLDMFHPQTCPLSQANVRLMVITSDFCPQRLGQCGVEGDIIAVHK